MLLSSTRRLVRIQWLSLHARCGRKQLLTTLALSALGLALFVMGIALSAGATNHFERLEGCSPIVTFDEPLNITTIDGDTHTIPPLPVSTLPTRCDKHR
jgi:hypothetical protein